MSWYVQAEGTPDEVATAVQRQFDNYGPGPSKDEFTEALPHLLWIATQVSNHGMKLTAGGSKSTAEASFHVKVETVYAKSAYTQS